MTGTFARSAPAADRNKEPILAVLRTALPDSGLVLEVASGTGQHIVHFARALPGLAWQPSDPDAGARASIAAHVDRSRLGNIRTPVALDAAGEDWPLARADAIVCINMIHIAPWAACEGLMAGAGRLLPSGGILYLYGPFRRDGRHTAPSNEAFDASLRARDPSWGVRDLEDVTRLAGARGFALKDTVAMPANNLSVIFSMT